MIGVSQQIEEVLHPLFSCFVIGGHHLIELQGHKLVVDDSNELTKDLVHMSNLETVDIVNHVQG